MFSRNRLILLAARLALAASFLWNAASCSGAAAVGKGKLLKYPRIYNAIVTSDETLLPSQAYPAISPFVYAIQYPTFLLVRPVDFHAASGTDSSSTSGMEPDNRYLPPSIMQPPPPPVQKNYAETPTYADYYNAGISNTLQAPYDDGVDLRRLPNRSSGPYGLPLPPSGERSAESGERDAVTPATGVQDDYPISQDGQGVVVGVSKPKPSSGEVPEPTKNNKPKDIVDVPPPPLPVGRKFRKEEKPDSYPPAPGMLFI